MKREAPDKTIQINLQSSARMMYDRKSAAQQLSISVRSLDYLISRSLIPTRRIGSRVLVRHEDLKKFARGNHTETVCGNKYSSRQ
jgi:hypothetical protein